MKKGSNKKKVNPFINPIELIVIGVHFILSFFTDGFYFDYWPPYSSDEFNRMFLFKGLFLIVLFVIWHQIFAFAKRIREKTVNKTWLKCTVAYLILLLITTLGSWPGFWEWDEYYILSATKILHIHIWQSLLSNVIYALSMMLIPFPTGVVIVQIIIVSIIVGYVLSFVFNEFKLGIIGKVILWIPFLLLPVLYYAQAPIRLGLYSFLELLFITLLYKLCKYSSWTMNETILSVILVSVIATWRTEGIFYLVIAPVLIWIFLKGEDRQYKTILVVAIAVLTLFQYFMQSHLYNKNTDDSYELTAYINPVEELVGYAATNNPDERDLELINSIGTVFDTEVLIEDYKSGIGGIGAFWAGNSIKQHTEDDLKTMKMAYVGLIKKYPGVFIRERLKMYWYSDMIICTTANLQNDERDMVAWFRDSCPLTGIINPQVRSFFVNLIETNNSYKLRKALWHPFATQAFLILLAIYCLIRKKPGYAGIIALVLIRVPLVIVTAPERYFMYYFPTYLIGAVACACVIARFFRAKGEETG